MRDVSGIELAIEGINFTASIVTLAAVKRYAPGLVGAIRRWRLRQPAGAEEPITLTVKGSDIDLRLDLPPNVSTQQLLQQLGPLLAKE